MKRVHGLGSFTLALAVASQTLVAGCGDDSGSKDDGTGNAGGNAGNGGTTSRGGTHNGGSSGKAAGAGSGGGKAANGGSASTTSGNGGSGGGKASGGTTASGGTDSAGNGGGGTPGVQPRRINVTASAVPVERLARSVLNPTPDEYEGMGEHSGESVVLGLKIKLTGITLSENPPGQAGGHGGAIFDWSAAPRELAIENGFSGVIEDSATLNLPDGNYQVVQVNYLSQYDLKAYAYLDTDKNGEVDTTIYTTAAGVVSVPSVTLPGDLVDLDYKHYGFTYTHNADSPTASTTTSFDFTLLPRAAEIGPAPALVELPGAGGEGGAAPAEGGAPSTVGGAPGNDAGAPAAAGEQGSAGDAAEPGAAGAAGDTGGDPETGDVHITLFIDAYRVVKAWDGVPPSSGSDHVDVLFPQGVGEYRSNDFGVDLVDLYPIGQPTFGLQYLPTFAFATASASDYTSESYLLAPSEPFLVANSQPLSVIFDGAGKPVIGRTGGNVDAVSLQIGQAARMFERNGSDGGTPLYRYYVEYGIRNADDIDDGGMYYHNDPSMAGHIVEGFRHLGAVGDTATLLVKDGPRCHAEYDRCYGDRTAVMRRVR